MLDQQSLLFDFLRDEGVLGVVGAARGEGGTLFLRPPPAPPKLTSAPPPMFDLAPEHFNRLLRLALRNVPVRLEVRLDSQFHEPAGTENVLGEILGGDKADEVVLVGAHVDSWHVGTGATDNAAGVAAVLEAVRILTTLRVPLRRTVRIAFWGGEELGRLGSRGYVASYLIGPTGTRLPEYDKLSGYLNIDYGSGRIRGVYLQGSAPLKPLLEPWLRGLGDGGLVATVRSTLGSDQASFERVGIPGLSFIQDPLNYEQRTHHTNMDHADYVLADDVADSAATVAALIYRVANAPATLPRKAAQ
jgi:Zn-dependent M28 family amino/carboxypeptidase